MKTLNLSQMENLEGGQAAKEIGRFIACTIAAETMAMVHVAAGIGMGALCSLGHLL